MNKINNKGFTLTELLAVMVILISVSLVAVGGISASLENRAEKECEEQIELAISAAKIYFSLKHLLLLIHQFLLFFPILKYK